MKSARWGNLAKLAWFVPCLADVAKVYKYRRRQPEESLLYQTFQENWATFVEFAQAHGTEPPGFVKRDVEKYLGCGILQHGFCRVLCKSCKTEHNVAFSCKGRGICASCGARRMNERAAFLVDHVFPRAPVRQWVLSLPFNLRYRLAYDAELCGRVISLFIAEVTRWYRDRAKEELGLESVEALRCGSVTFIQRFDSALRVNLHFHAVFLDGVYVVAAEAGNDDDGEQQKPVFLALPPPTDQEVADIAQNTRFRVLEFLAARGLDPDDDGCVDEFALEQPLLSGLTQAAVANLKVAGEQAGRRPGRLYDGPPTPGRWRAPGPRCADADGFNLHANTRVGINDRKGLEKLLRYGCRPPISAERLTKMSDGRLAYQLKRKWSDGTTAVVFEPLELIARLLPLIPPPRCNQVRYHGLFAPASPWRAAVVPARRTKKDANGKPRSKNYTWAEIMKRTFAIQVLVCPKCQGPMELIAVIVQADVIQAILKARGLPLDPPEMAQPRPDPQQELWDAA